MERQAPPGAGRTACSTVAARSGRQPVARRVEGGDRCRAAAAGAAGAGCGVARLAGCSGQRRRAAQPGERSAVAAPGAGRAARRHRLARSGRLGATGLLRRRRGHRPALGVRRAPHRRGAATGLLPAQCLAGPRRVRPGQAPRPALRRQRAADRAVERSQAGRETQRLAGAGARLPVGARDFPGSLGPTACWARR